MDGLKKAANLKLDEAKSWVICTEMPEFPMAYKSPVCADISSKGEEVRVALEVPPPQVHMHKATCF